MPNWKKVLVSGSNAHLNQITSSGGITTDGIINTTEITASDAKVTGTLTFHDDILVG